MAGVGGVWLWGGGIVKIISVIGYGRCCFGKECSSSEGGGGVEWGECDCRGCGYDDEVLQ